MQYLEIGAINSMKLKLCGSLPPWNTIYLLTQIHTIMFNIIIEDDLSQELNKSLKDKHLEMSITRFGKPVIANYILIDSEIPGDVVKDLENNVIKLLGELMPQEQQTDALVITIYRNNVVVFEFTSTYKALRKNLNTVYRALTEKAFIDQNKKGSKDAKKHVMNQYKDQTTTLLLLNIFGLLAQRTSAFNYTLETWTAQNVIDATDTDENEN